MKTHLLLGILISITCMNKSSAEGLSLPASDVGISDSISSNLPAPFTAEEIATPPAGEIQKKYLREVNASRSGLAAVLGAVPQGPEGKESPLFAKLQTTKTSLDELASSCLESQLFSLIPVMAEVFDAESENPPRFVGESIGWLQNISPPILYTIAQHITRHNATVAAGNVTSFVRLFSTRRGFISGGDWEDEPMPVNASGVMILDAAAVVTQLKAGPWQQAKQFLGGATTASGFFVRYTVSGDGLAVLKTKYAANQSTIDAKFDELRTWADQQEQQAGGGD